MRKKFSQRIARRSFLTGAVACCALPVLVAYAGIGNVRILEDLLDNLPGVKSLAQLSDFPPAVFAGAALVMLLSIVITAVLCMSEDVIHRVRHVHAQQGLPKRILVGVGAVFLLLAPWLIPYRRGGGTWSAPLSELIARSPLALGVLFLGLFMLSVASLMFFVSYFWRGDK
jgi:hypothetical protein